MANDIYLKIEGPDVKGESQDSVHKDEIDVLSWSWGVTNAGSSQYGGGAGTGRAVVKDLVITKRVDAATPSLILTALNGKPHDKATLVVRKAGGQGPVEYLMITLEQVFVTSVTDTGEKQSDGSAIESVSFNFAKVSVQYTPQNPDGSAGTPDKIGWDILAYTLL